MCAMEVRDGERRKEKALVNMRYVMVTDVSQFSKMTPHQLREYFFFSSRKTTRIDMTTTTAPTTARAMIMLSCILQQHKGMRAVPTNPWWEEFTRWWWLSWRLLWFLCVSDPNRRTSSPHNVSPYLKFANSVNQNWAWLRYMETNNAYSEGIIC